MSSFLAASRDPKNYPAQKAMEVPEWRAQEQSYELQKARDILRNLNGTDEDKAVPNHESTRASGVAPAGSTIRLVHSVVGAKGEQRNGTFVMTEPRSRQPDASYARTLGSTSEGARLSIPPRAPLTTHPLRWPERLGTLPNEVDAPR
jgi:hypothetical protein